MSTLSRSELQDSLHDKHRETDANVSTRAALVIGATGGIGSALAAHLRRDTDYGKVISVARHGEVPFDLLNEQSIVSAAKAVAEQTSELRLIIDATGVLEDANCKIEKNSGEISQAAMAHAFAVNTIGPALLIKHFVPLFPKTGLCVFVTLSARLGSITDNHLGGWYSYRASKAALNQIVRTAAIELRRTRPQTVCIALHPGAVDTDLSQRFAKTGLEVQSPELAAQRILHFINQISTQDSGGFFDQMGRMINW